MLNRFKRLSIRIKEHYRTEGLFALIGFIVWRAGTQFFSSFTPLIIKYKHDELIHLEKKVDELREENKKHSSSIRVLASLYAQSQGRCTSEQGLLISIIMPVYDRPEKVISAIESVLNQSYTNIELIVIDDGSQDELLNVIEQNIALVIDSRLKLSRVTRRGAAAARNYGLAIAQGDICLFLDSDNVMYSGYLGLVSDFYLEHEDVNIAYAALLWDDGNDNVFLRHDDFNWTKLFRQEVNLDLNCFSFKHRLFAELGGFDQSLTRYSDYDLALRYCKVHRPAKLPAIAANYFSGYANDRITLNQPSLPNFYRISSKHKFYNIRNIGLKILIYTYDYPQLSESYVDTEIAWLQRMGMNVEVFSHTEPGSKGKELTKSHKGHIEDAIEKFQPHIIHVHWLNMAEQVCQAARQFNIPVTIRGHGFEFEAGLFDRIDKLNEVKGIYLFPHLLEKLDRQPSRKLLPVPVCFDSSRFYPRVEKDKRLVLRAGACLPTKSIETFIETAAQCREFKFVLVLAKVASQMDLPDKFIQLNKKLGYPAELRFDVSHSEMTELVAKAGIYMHTFGFVQAYGMPISIAESMASGSICLLPYSPETVEYAGEHNFYYRTVDEAVTHIYTIFNWSDDTWRNMSNMNSDYAYKRYMDDIVMEPILLHWQQVSQGQ